MGFVPVRRYSVLWKFPRRRQIGVFSSSPKLQGQVHLYTFVSLNWTMGLMVDVMMDLMKDFPDELITLVNSRPPDVF